MLLIKNGHTVDNAFLVLILTRVKVFNLLVNKLQKYFLFGQTRNFYRFCGKNIDFAKDSSLLEKLFSLLKKLFLSFKGKFKISIKISKMEKVSFSRFRKCFSNFENFFRFWKLFLNFFILFMSILKSFSWFWKKKFRFWKSSFILIFYFVAFEKCFLLR